MREARYTGVKFWSQGLAEILHWTSCKWTKVEGGWGKGQKKRSKGNVLRSQRKKGGNRQLSYWEWFLPQFTSEYKKSGNEYTKMAISGEESTEKSILEMGEDPIVCECKNRRVPKKGENHGPFRKCPDSGIRGPLTLLAMITRGESGQSDRGVAPFTKFPWGINRESQ